jgi:hypothetical protein
MDEIKCNKCGAVGFNTCGCLTIEHNEKMRLLLTK